MSALTADGLTRRFGDLVAVNNLTFEVPDGVVVGFVGPNGSGKSTTIRVLLGLIEASGGTGTVLGEPIEHPERFADRVGALIESPAFVGSLSGRDNLRSLAALRGLPGKRIDEVLEIVGLVGREGDKASTYSLGMKQRLGIAAALLPDPELLVLDEPTNGLDPAGIVEIRDLLRSRAAERADGRRLVASSQRDPGDGGLPGGDSLRRAGLLGQPRRPDGQSERAGGRDARVRRRRSPFAGRRRGQRLDWRGRGRSGDDRTCRSSGRPSSSARQRRQASTCGC